MDLKITLMSLFFSTLRVSTPLIFAALGGMLSEKSGTIQIGLEGYMLTGSLVAAIVTHFTHSPWLGLIIAGFAGAAMAGLTGLFVLKFKTDQIVTGTAMNILALGLAPFLTKMFFNSTGTTPSLAIDERFAWEPMALAAFTILIVYIWIEKTRTGLWIQFAGEAPEALKVSGTRVGAVRWMALLSCGKLAGIGGATLSLFLSSAYSPNMTAGRGFMALAALILGRWKPVRTALACLLFAFLDAIQIRLQGVDSGFPVQFVQILPYLVTIIALAGFFGQSRPPKALGQRL